MFVCMVCIYVCMYGMYVVCTLYDEALQIYGKGGCEYTCLYVYMYVCMYVCSMHYI